MVQLDSCWLVLWVDLLSLVTYSWFYLQWEDEARAIECPGIMKKLPEEFSCCLSKLCLLYSIRYSCIYHQAKDARLSTTIIAATKLYLPTMARYHI